MNANMYEHPATQANLRTLAERGVRIVPPGSGRLASHGEEGIGRMAEPAELLAACQAALGGGADPGPAAAPDDTNRPRPLDGVRVLVTAGGTREAIDPVRYLGNRSSGKMGHAVAAAAARRGARVTLVTTSDRAAAAGVEVVPVTTAEEMAEAVLGRYDDVDAVVMAAAVADFRPKAPAAEKLKKQDGVPELLLEPTPDILAALGAAKRGQVLVGFAAETEQLRARAAEKLAAKRLDLVVGNDVSAADAGFEVDTNRAILLDSDGSVEELPLLPKTTLAATVLDRVRDLLEQRGPRARNP
jgi:phosphopantothenoylcysteine decarboxylase / phosphopantothenate---cysteine ligase